MADNRRLTLYCDDLWISPYVFSAFVALKEKGLAFETRLVALSKGEQLRPEYQDRSLTARVPSLEDGDFMLAESSAIIEYIEELYPAPKHTRLLPEDIRDRARARQVMSWLRSDLLALREERSTATMFYERADKPLSPNAAGAAKKLIRVADGLIREGQTTIFGRYSSADSDLAFMIERLIINGDEVPPKLRAFAEAQWSRPSVREFLEKKRPLHGEH